MAQIAKKGKFRSLGKRLSRIQTKRPKAAKSELNSDTSNQPSNSASRIQTAPLAPVSMRLPLKSDISRIDGLKLENLPRARAQFSDSVALTARQYADKAAQEYAHKAYELIAGCIDDMGVAIRVIKEELPFAEGKEIPKLVEGYRGAMAEVKSALGLRDDIDASGSRALVQIQCVGSVSVSEAAAPMAIELPDVDFE